MSKSPKDHHRPHHHHALTKGSAEHLHKAGLIDDDTHERLVDHAEKGMARARRNRDRGEEPRR